MLDVWERLPALRTQAVGPEAPRQTAPFIQNHCQKKKNRATREDAGTHRKNCGPLQLVTHFREKCHFMWLNKHASESFLTAWGMLGLAKCSCESHFILIYPFVDEYTHSSSQTYTGHYATLKSSQSNRERQQRVWLWIEMMSKWLWHSNQSPQSLPFFYWWFSVAGWIMSVTSIHRSSNKGLLLLLFYAVTHYIATITMFRLCLKAVTALKSFGLSACLHHHHTCKTPCARPEMFCCQCISSNSSRGYEDGGD